MRWLHRIRAFVMRDWWLPCPSCGRMFASHEVAWRDPAWPSLGGFVLCPSESHRFEQSTAVITDGHDRVQRAYESIRGAA